jgi:hypothetical protein
MNFVELFEGATPKLPGAVAGIKVMSMDQFLAQSGDEPEEKIDEMSSEELDKMSPEELAQFTHNARTNKSKVDNKTIDKAYGKSMSIMFPDSNKRNTPSTNHKQQNVNEGIIGDVYNKLKSMVLNVLGKKMVKKPEDQIAFQRMMGKVTAPVDTTQYARLWQEYKNNKQYYVSLPTLQDMSNKEHMFMWANSITQYIMNKFPDASVEALSQAVEGLSSLAAKEFIQKHRDLDEATKLPAQTRELKGQELDDYLDRIRNREKGKTDKYKLPYIHRSSVVKYYNEEGKRYDTDQIKKALGIRPAKLLKQNEKMKHSNGELEQFFNIGFAALVGIALDEGTNELIVVNTCPGAGSCKIDCFAMKGGKVQFEGPWLSDGRILTFLLNDPDGFFNQLSSDITKEEKKAQKGGYNLTIRWHDAGDFFSPEYQDLAFKLAASHPDVKFYAYTKIADAALGQKPANFIVNWSEGASTSQEKQVKAQDPQLDVTKNSRIVPSKLFYDLLKKDEKGNLDKTADGAWQPRDSAALEELKNRLAATYNLKRDSIIDYNEMMATPQKNNIKKWNVIIAPGEGDISANRQDVLSTLLLKH